MIEVGMKAPQFTLPDKNGNMISLSDFLGKKVVLYFYPKDNTSGCTRQACAFAIRNKEIENKNAVVIGISKDSVSSHLNFATKYNLPFVLLSDTELKAIQAYGVWQEKKKKIKETCENSVKSLECFVRRRYNKVIKNLFSLGRALLF